MEILAAAPLELVLGAAAGTVSGLVAFDGGQQPAAGVPVVLIPSGAPVRPVKQMTGEDGRFRFAALPPGTFTVLAWETVDEDSWQDPEFRQQFTRQAAEVAVGPGEAKDLSTRAISPSYSPVGRR